MLKNWNILIWRVSDFLIAFLIELVVQARVYNWKQNFEGTLFEGKLQITFNSKKKLLRLKILRPLIILLPTINYIFYYPFCLKVNTWKNFNIIILFKICFTWKIMHKKVCVKLICRRNLYWNLLKGCVNVNNKMFRNMFGRNKIFVSPNM